MGISIWTLYGLVLIFKVTFSLLIPLIYVKTKKLNLDVLGLTRKNFALAVGVGTILAMLLYLISFCWAFYLFDYGWKNINQAKFYLKEIGCWPFILFITFDSLVNLGIPEEMFFRGFLFSIIERKLNSKYAIILSSVVFALSHINRPLHVPLMLIFSFILSFSFSRLRNLALPIIAHSLQSSYVRPSNLDITHRLGRV